jgi:hypothetical protein
VASIDVDRTIALFFTKSHASVASSSGVEERGKEGEREKKIGREKEREKGRERERERTS